MPQPAGAAATRKAARAKDGSAAGGLIGNLLFTALAWALGWGVGSLVAVQTWLMMTTTGTTAQTTTFGNRSIAMAQDSALAGAIGGALAGVLLTLVVRGRWAGGILSFLLSLVVWTVVQVADVQGRTAGDLTLPEQSMALFAGGGAVLGLLATLGMIGRLGFGAVLRSPLGALAGALGAVAGRVYFTM